MKVTLKNFRCHRNGVFVLPDSGLTLLAGVSGVGKSTILNAIVYALYGHIKKPYSHGSDSCSVILERGGLVITRNAKPRSLTVLYKDTTYIDDEAQNVIEQVTGMDHREFMTSSYVVQSLHNSVVSMTPSEQTKFIEVLAFSDNTHTEFKKIFRDNTKVIKTRLDEIRGQIQILESQVDDAAISLPEEVDPPDEEILLKKKSIDDDINNLETRLNEKRNQYDRIQKNKEKYNSILQQQKAIQIEIEQLKYLRSEIDGVFSEEELLDLQTRLEDLDTELFNTETYQEIQTLGKKYKKYLADHNSELAEKIKSLESQIPSPKEIESLRKDLADHLSSDGTDDLDLLDRNRSRETASANISRISKEARSLYKKDFLKAKTPAATFNVLKKKLSAVENEKISAGKLVDELKKTAATSTICNKMYSCPSCSSNLWIVDGELAIAENLEKNNKDTSLTLDDALEKYESKTALYEKMERWVTDYESAITTIKKLGKKKEETSSNYDEIKRLNTILSTVDSTLNEISVLKKTRVSAAILDMKKCIKSKQADIPKGYKPNTKVKDIKSRIKELSRLLEKHWENSSRRVSYTKDITEKNRRLSSLNLPEFTLLKDQGVEEEVNLLRIELNELYDQRAGIKNIEDQIVMYREYKSAAERLEKVERCYNEAKELLLITERNYEGALGLEKAGKDAEIIAMRETMFSINNHAAQYLEMLFDSPISVRLEGNKITGKGISKTQINTKVEYKGENYSSISQLSGGEAQRVELAFLLAVNEIVGSKMILLDECLNNLDAGINMDVISKLRDFCSDRLILVVSHEAVQGAFDTVVQIEE